MPVSMGATAEVAPMSVLRPYDRHQWWAPSTSTCFLCSERIERLDLAVMWCGADGHSIILHTGCAPELAQHLVSDARRAAEQQDWWRSCTEHTDADSVLCPRRNIQTYFDWLFGQDTEQLGDLLRTRLDRAYVGTETPDDRLIGILVGVVLQVRETGVAA
jgi:hypothetical protein